MLCLWHPVRTGMRCMTNTLTLVKLICFEMHIWRQSRGVALLQNQNFSIDRFYGFRIRIACLNSTPLGSIRDTSANLVVYLVDDLLSTLLQMHWTMYRVTSKEVLQDISYCKWTQIDRNSILNVDVTLTSHVHATSNGPIRIFKLNSFHFENSNRLE